MNLVTLPLRYGMQKVAKRMEAASQDKVVGGSEKSTILPCWGFLLPHTFLWAKNIVKVVIALLFTTYRNTFKSMLLLTIMVRRII